ncbi:hypothetical protein [Ktedonobacter robiniae]|uniref:30S ribosomal protein S14 n=1 Tax=Ktedonobacter robiniae TaxID=2778365 RepID=A0ABQ3UPB4_9CHLR|nr:hypothetical protein [Ktedonobacter robiniae]GHO54502.1 hypothetical protein KSB_29770 [Ktedonobacter robiniae]
MARNKDARRIAERRAEFEAEQKRLVTAFTKGYLDEKDLDTQLKRLRRPIQCSRFFLARIRNTSAYKNRRKLKNALKSIHC